MTQDQINRINAARREVERVIAKARSYKHHPDAALIAEYEAHRAKLDAMLREGGAA